jgi:hypothetical protein
LSLAGCRGAPIDPPDAAPSPQASAEPAPLANVGAAASAAATTTSGLDGSVPPEALRGDVELAADTPHEVARELTAKDVPHDPRELSGYELQVVLHSGEGPPATKGPEINTAAVDVARHKTEAHLLVQASQTRARLVVGSGFVLPAGTELRARSDRYGHVVLFPAEDGYRIAEPGAIRALLGERRLDVAPVSPVETVGGGEGARRLNLRTRRVDMATRAAKATFEIAAFRDAGEGGALVCRLLLDLMGGPPAASPCATDEVPLHAELRWTTQGSLTFDVTAIAHRTDLLAQDLAAPPSSRGLARGAPPVPAGEVLLSRSDLAALRTGPVEVPLTHGADAQAPLPDSGLVLVNATDELRLAWLDGVAVAWVAPAGSVTLPSLVHGRYVLQWRTFLGDGWEAPQPVVVPGHAEVGSVEPTAH